MPSFAAHDGTTLTYHVHGDGEPLICVPGGPMQASAYLAQLGGLSTHRRLIMLDLRGTGDSAIPADPATYRCDRQVDDVEALREHLDLKNVDLLGHSAGTNLAILYAIRHPERVNHLALITPSLIGVGINVTGEDRLTIAQLRAAEEWFNTAFAALTTLVAGNGTAETMEAIAPFFYGRWDETARNHHAAGPKQRNAEATAAYGGQGAFNPENTRTALATFTSPVLLLAGELDLNSPPQAVAELAALIPQADLVVQAGAGHFPWLDDAKQFAATTAAFLT